MVAMICTKELKRVIQALKPFTGSIYNNKLMEYIHFDVNYEENEIKFEALDGHRVAIEYLDCEAAENFSGYLNPVKIGKTFNEFCELELTDGKVLLDIDDLIYRTIQPTEEWYDTNKMLKDIEDKEPHIVGMDAALLEDALKYHKLTNWSKYVQIEVRGKEQALIVRNQSNRKNIRAVLPIRIYD